MKTNRWFAALLLGLLVCVAGDLWAQTQTNPSWSPITLEQVNLLPSPVFEVFGQSDRFGGGDTVRVADFGTGNRANADLTIDRGGVWCTLSVCSVLSLSVSNLTYPTHQYFNGTLSVPRQCEQIDGLVFRVTSETGQSCPVSLTDFSLNGVTEPWSVSVNNGTSYAYLQGLQFTGDDLELKFRLTMDTRNYSYGDRPVEFGITGVPAVPEPTTLSIVVLGGLLFILKRKFR